MLSFLPRGISPFAADIDGVMAFIYWVVGAWFVLALVVLGWLVWSSRARPGRRAAWLPGGTARTNAWILVPVSLVLVCDLLIEAKADPVWHDVKVAIPAGDVKVRITGRQYAWVFTYPGVDGQFDTADDVATAELHVPRDKVVRFDLRSADVLHSFFVPELRLKQDAVPGRSIAGWFSADRDGSYEIACAEICGKNHTLMAGKMVVEAEDAFDTWLASQ